MGFLASLLVSIHWLFPVTGSTLDTPAPVPLQVVAASPAGVLKVVIYDAARPRSAFCVAKPIADGVFQCYWTLPTNPTRLRLRAVALDADGNTAREDVQFRGKR